MKTFQKPVSARVLPVLVCWLAVLLVVPGSVVAARISVESDRNAVYLGDAFQLVFTAEGEVNGNPDFSPLSADFDLLDRSLSRSTRVINGHASSSTRWVLTLMARALGEHEIPAIHFGSDSSRPFPINVRAAARAESSDQDIPGELFMEAELAPAEVLVGSEIILTTRLLYNQPLTGGRFSDPITSDPDAEIHRLGPDQHYETVRHTTKYRVTERRYAIFPSSRGRLQVEPIQFDARVLSTAPSVDQPPKPRIRRVESTPVEIRVLPVPKRADVSPWLPARSLRLQESWPQQGQPMRPGTPIVRRIALIAEGQPASRLPALDAGLSPELKLYDQRRPLLQDQPGSEGITGIRTQQFTFAATRPGDYELPPVEVAWWNTVTGEREIARLPERSLTIAAAPARPAPPPWENFRTPRPASAEQPTDLSTPVPASPIAGRIAQIGRYQWLALGLGLVWLATMILWWRSRSPSRQPVSPAQAPTPQPQITPSPPPVQAGETNLNEAIRKAYQRRDRWGAKSAILLWAKNRWPDHPPNTLGDLAARSSRSVADAVRKLDAAIYANQHTNWYDVPLWEELEQQSRTGR